MLVNKINILQDEFSRISKVTADNLSPEDKAALQVYKKTKGSEYKEILKSGLTPEQLDQATPLEKAISDIKSFQGNTLVDEESFQ